MAIEKYYCDQSSKEENGKDVVAWLTANATEYFDAYSYTAFYGSIPMVICTLGDTAVLQFATTYNSTDSSRTSLIITLGNGATVNATYTAHSLAKYILKTTGGVMIYMDDAHMVFITKSNAGNTAVYVKWDSAFYAADLLHSQSISTKNIPDIVEANDITEVAPMVFPTGTYATNLFFTPYSQHVGKAGIIDINGTKYVYDGYVALRE